VLEQQHGAGATGHDAGVHLALQLPRRDVLDGVAAEPNGLEDQVLHADEPTPEE
jgi:hypothetical protein